MSDYTKTTTFDTKDGLTTGDPLKLIKGAEFEVEFDAIATAIATKYDSNDNASSAETITGTSTTKLVTPDGLADYVMSAHLIGATTTLLTPSGGASGWTITNPSTGQYTLTHGFGDNKYRPFIDFLYTGASNLPWTHMITAKGGTSFSFSFFDSTGANVDPTQIYILVKTHA
jgi:hypothetical protein